MELEFCLELAYQIQTTCFDETEGLKDLEPFIQSSRTFFELLGCTILFEEFGQYDQFQESGTHIAGYNISVIFYGKAAGVFKLPIAASLFFDAHDVKKISEEYYFVKKGDHN